MTFSVQQACRSHRSRAYLGQTLETNAVSPELPKLAERGKGGMQYDTAVSTRYPGVPARHLPLGSKYFKYYRMCPSLGRSKGFRRVLDVKANTLLSRYRHVSGVLAVVLPTPRLRTT